MNQHDEIEAALRSDAIEQIRYEKAVHQLTCSDCGVAEAACVGNYEDHSEEDCPHEDCTQHGDSPACDECCGHGCEDGSCTPLFDEDGDIDADSYARVNAYLERVLLEAADKIEQKEQG